MNRKQIQKVIDELGKDKPDLSYIKGILETIIEGLDEPQKGYPRVQVPYTPNYQQPPFAIPTGPYMGPVLNEGTQLDLAAKAKLGNIDFKAIETQN